MIFKYCFSDSNIRNIRKFIDVFNVTECSHVDIVLNIDILKSYFYNKSIPILNKLADNEDDLEGSPFNITFYNLTRRFENMVISTSKTNSFLKGDYKDAFSKYLFDDFSQLFSIEIQPNNTNLLGLFENGFKPIALNIFEKLRFFLVAKI